MVLRERSRKKEGNESGNVLNSEEEEDDLVKHEDATKHKGL